MAKSFTQLIADINTKIRNKTSERSITRTEVADVNKEIVDKLAASVPEGGTEGQTLSVGPGGTRVWVSQAPGGSGLQYDDDLE